MSPNSYLPEFCAQVSQYVLLADLTVLRLITVVICRKNKNGRKLISPRVYCSSITNRVLSWFDRFTAYYYCMNKKFHKTHISTSFVHSVSQIASLPDLTVLRLNTTVWEKMSQNSYLHELCTQITQIVFLADLTVLRLITTVWAKNLKKLISPQVLCTTITKRVFSWFDRFTAY